MVSPEKFRDAMEASVDRYNAATTHKEKIALSQAAFLFAQVAEHLERGNSLTQSIITRCRDETSMFHDDCTRRRIDFGPISALRSY
jgi:hypothetical protein